MFIFNNIDVRNILYHFFTNGVKKNAFLINFKSILALTLVPESTGKKITVILDPVAGPDKNSKIFVDGESSGASLVLKNEGKREIPTMTLKSILDEFNVSSAVLKLNCEGCEYETILNTPENILKKFSYIFLEYHHGRKNLKEKLERSGFHVIAKENHDSKHKGKGYIYAKLK